MPGGGEDDGGKRRDLRGVVAAPAADASAEETRAFLGEVAQEGEVLAGHLEEFFKTVARLQGSSAMAKKAGVMAEIYAGAGVDSVAAMAAVPPAVMVDWRHGMQAQAFVAAPPVEAVSGETPRYPGAVRAVWGIMCVLRGEGAAARRVGSSREEGDLGWQATRWAAPSDTVAVE